MSNEKSSISIPLVAGIATAVIAVGAAAYYLASSSDKTEEENHVDTRNQPSKKPVTAKLPKITKEKLLATYHRINLYMESVTTQLLSMKLSALQQLKTGEAQFTADQVTEFIMSEFENALAGAEKDTYTNMHVTEDEVTEAQDYYHEDAEVVEKINILKALYEKINEEPAPLPEVPAHLTMDETIRITTTLLESMNISMEEACEEVRISKNFPDMASFKQALQNDENLSEAVSQLFITKDAQAKKKIQSDVNASALELQAACLKYQSIPEFSSKLHEATVKQQTRFQELGVFSN